MHRQNSNLMAVTELRRFLSKADGAGSRGGKILGYTRSNKPIYASSHGHYKTGGDAAPTGKQFRTKFQSEGYTAQDHRDAAELHEAVSDKHFHPKEWHQLADRIASPGMSARTTATHRTSHWISQAHRSAASSKA